MITSFKVKNNLSSILLHNIRANLTDKLELTNSFITSEKELKNKISKNRYKYIISFGQKPNCDHIYIELFGNKVNKKIKTSFPYKNFAEFLKENNVVYSLSTNAGNYLCNNIYYEGMKYIEEIELTDKYAFLNVNYIKFRESVANVSNELYFNGYYDRYIPSIFGNIYGQIRFSEYLPEKEVGEQIMRLRQFYDVGYYEATYNVKNQVFYFNFIEDNKALVRVFPLEDYRKIDPDIKMETYNLGVLYVKEDKRTLLENEDDVFKYMPAECESNVVYSKEPINVDVKPVPY